MSVLFALACAYVASESKTVKDLFVQLEACDWMTK
jgi:hypothetical protein